MREIMTLQIGSYSNYVGCHWLNVQEAGLSYNPKFVPDINSNLTFREGITSLGDATYTPRLLLLDLEGKLGYLPESGGIYQMEKDPGMISELNNVDVTQINPPYEKNLFLLDMEKLIKAKKEGNTTFRSFLRSSYDLTDSVHNWSDYLVQRLHPESITSVGHFNLLDEPSLKWYRNGVEAWQNKSFSESYTDKLQRFIEECDSLQGFQTVADTSDGFSGVTVSVHEYLRDEYPKKVTIVSLPFCDNDYNTSNNEFGEANVGFALGCLTEYADLLLPLSTYSGLFIRSPLQPMKNIILSASKNKYIHSSILAAALDTISIPYRMRNNDFSMNDYCNQLCISGRKMCSTSICLPFPLKQNEYLLPLLENWEEPLLTSLTPYIDYKMSDNTIQYVNARGIQDSQLIPETGKIDFSNPAYSCSKAEEMISLFCKFLSGGTITHSVSTHEPFRVPVTYPPVFNTDFNLVPNNSDITVGRLSEYRILAGIHNSYSMKNFIDAVMGECVDKKIKKILPYIEGDELSIALEKLNTFGELYVESWDL